MSATPNTVPSKIAKKTNASKWPLFRTILGDLSDSKKFMRTAESLNVYLRSRKGYYQDARPEIVSVLESAAHAFDRLARTYVDLSIEPSTEGNSSCDTLPGDVPCPPDYIQPLRSFQQMVKTVHDHIDEFKKTPETVTDKLLVARLEPIFSVFITEPRTSSSAEKQPSEMSPHATAPESSRSETSHFSPLDSRPFSSTPSRVTSPSASSLLLLSTCSPFSQQLPASARQHNITLHEDTPEMIDETYAASSNNLDALLAINPVMSTGSPGISTPIGLAPAPVPDVEMSNMMVFESPENAPANANGIFQVHGLQSAGKPVTINKASSESSETLDSIDHGDARMQEVDSPDVAEAAAATEEEHSLFGPDYQVICFQRGQNFTSSVTLTADNIPYDSVQLWQNIKNGSTEPSSISDSRCLSFVIFDADEVVSRQNARPDASVEYWFHHTHCISPGDINLRHLFGTMHGRSLPFPTYCNSQGSHFVDLSAWTDRDNNTLQIAHDGDVSRYTFALILHRPTFAQEFKARRLYAAKSVWFAEDEPRV